MTKHTHAIALRLCLSALAFGACSSSAKPAGSITEQLDGAAAALGGIYEITRMTTNGAGCDEEGPAGEPSDGRYFKVMRRVEGKYVDQIVAHACRDLDDCKATTPQSSARWIDHFSAVEGDEVTGESLTMGFGDKDKKLCTRGERATLRLVPTDGGVRIERRQTFVDYPADAQGMCSTGTVDELTRGKCGELVVVTGKRVAP